MLGRFCFPFFDSRFAREDLEPQTMLAPRWLYGEPPPPIQRLGNLGQVQRWIPPRPFARCVVNNILSIGEAPSSQENAWDIQFEEIDLIASQAGHTRLTAEFVMGADCGDKLDAFVERIVTAEVAIRHPERRGVYDMLGSAAASLADLYARESARTVGSGAGYSPDWVSFGRPFLVLIDTCRLPIAVPQAAIEVTVAHPGFSGRVSFIPWRLEDEGIFLPVWFIQCPRGGAIWRPIAEAIEDLTADYEELFVCSAMCEQLNQTNLADSQLSNLLSRNSKRLKGTLRKPIRHGVDLQVALRFLSDYDQSKLSPRDSSGFEASLAARVQAEVSQNVGLAPFSKTIAGRSVQVTIYQGNIINYGIMADNTITITNTMLAESDASDELKDKLKELRKPLIEAAKSLPESEAKTLLEDYESFTKLALRENPPKAVVEAQGNNLIDVVKKVAAFATPVAAIVAAVVKIVAGA